MAHLRVGELAFLVQDLGRHRQLADVMQQHTPAQPVHVPLGQPHLAADQLGMGPHTLGVASGEAFVSSELGDERDGMLGRVLHRVARERLARPQLLHCAASKCQAEPRGSVVREHQRHLEQRRQRSQPIRQLRPEMRRKPSDDDGLQDPGGRANPSFRSPVAGLRVANRQPADEQRREEKRSSHEERNRRSSDPARVVELRRAARRLSFHIHRFGRPHATLETVS